MNIYFAGSIVGDPKFKTNQQLIVNALEKLGHVVVSKQHAFQIGSEVGNEKGMTPERIFERDLWWLMRKSEVVIAELSMVSYGLGFEMGVASVMGLPILGLVSKQVEKMSAFVKGNEFSGYKWREYDEDDLGKIIKDWFDDLDVFAKKRRGVYVAFEGLNQCGKGTQVKMLVERLMLGRYSVWQGREPGTTYIGEELRKLLQIQTEEVPMIRAEVAMLMAQRAQLVEKEVKDHLLLDEVVVSDRSDGTSLAFQGFGRKQGILRMAALNGYAVDQVHPDAVIYLQVPSKVVKVRGKKMEEHDRFEHEDDNFEELCRQGYEEAIRLDEAAPPKTWFAVDAVGAPEEVHARVWEVVKPYLDQVNKRRENA